MQNKNPLKEYLITAAENSSTENNKFKIEDNMDYSQTKNVLEYEQDLSEPTLIVTIESGCPICMSDLKGNVEQGFYCEKCNLLFTHSDLIHLGTMPKPYFD